MEGPELAWDLKLLRPRPFTHIYHLGQLGHHVTIQGPGGWF